MSSSPSPGCCVLARRLTPSALTALNAALLSAHAGTGAEGFNAICRRTGLRKETVLNHRDVCVLGGAERVKAASACVARAPVTPLDATEQAAERIEVIAAVMQGAEGWRDHASVVELAAQFRCPSAEVERLHRVATTKVRAARGTAAAQQEASVALTKQLRDEHRAEARRYSSAARSKMKSKDFDPLEVSKLAAAATSARAGALAAQRHIDAITIAAAKPVQVQVSIQAAPDFAAAWAVVKRVLDERYTGASEDVETVLGAFEERGDEGATEALATLTAASAAALN